MSNIEKRAAVKILDSLATSWDGRYLYLIHLVLIKVSSPLYKILSPFGALMIR